MSGYAISNWQDAKDIYARLAKLTSQPIYSISDEELKRVLEHFDTKCAKSKEITTSYCRDICFPMRATKHKTPAPIK